MNNFSRLWDGGAVPSCVVALHPEVIRAGEYWLEHKSQIEGVGMGWSLDGSVCTYASHAHWQVIYDLQNLATHGMGSLPMVSKFPDVETSE